MNDVQSSASNLSRSVQYLDLKSSNEDSGNDIKQQLSESMQCILCLKICSVPISSKPASDKSFQCNLCKKQTNKTDGVITQIKVYSDDNIDRNPKDDASKTIDILKCNVCYRKFKVQKDLETHISIQESNHPSKCDICSKEYYRLCHINTHNKSIYSGLRPHLCTICGKQFFCRQHLLKHKKVHPVEKLHSCNECPRKFAARHHMTLHARVHKSVDMYTCDLCPETFCYKGQLAVHMKKHNEYRVECDICEKLFFSKPLLNAHKVMHGLDLTVENETPTAEHEINDITIIKQEVEIKTHECNICHKLYQSKERLKNHIINIHKTKAVVWKCDLCNVTISNYTNLLRHKRSIHKKYYETQIHCQICMKVFQSSQLLGDHMRMHTIQLPHRCDTCGKRYRSIRYMENHIKSKHCKKVDTDLEGNKNDILKKSPGLNGEEEKPSCDQDKNTGTSSTDDIIEID